MSAGFGATLARHAAVIAALASCEDAVEAAAECLRGTFARGGRLLLCGNGGSAAQSQHIAAEFVVRYRAERRPLPALALSTDTSMLTAYSNDYAFAGIFARQVEALGQHGDCLLAISTSGNSANVVLAARTARERGLAVIALTGAGGGDLGSHADHLIKVPTRETARVQEAHLLIAHWWCAQFEPEERD